jgi:hypothetical protein
MINVMRREIALGFVLVLSALVWMLFWSILAMWLGLGWGTGNVLGPPGVVDLGVHPMRLAIYGAFAALGLIPLSLGLSFLFAVRRLGKPVGKPRLKPSPSRQVWRFRVEVILVVAILGVAVLVVRTTLTDDPSSYVRAPGP